jgi:hypothetical protein
MVTNGQITFSNTGLRNITSGADGSYFHNTNAEVSYNTQVENDFPNSVDSTGFQKTLILIFVQDSLKHSLSKIYKKN